MWRMQSRRTWVEWNQFVFVASGGGSVCSAVKRRWAFDGGGGSVRRQCSGDPGFCVREVSRMGL